MTELAQLQFHKSSAPPKEIVPKRCNRCGCDLTRAPRYRDDEGYWCATCNKADKHARRADRVRCDDCGRRTPREHLIRSAEFPICPECWHKRRAQAAQMELQAEAEQRQVQDDQHRRARRKRTFRVLAAELALALPVAIYLLMPAKAEDSAPADPTSVAPTTQPVFRESTAEPALA